MQAKHRRLHGETGVAVQGWQGRQVIEQFGMIRASGRERKQFQNAQGRIKHQPEAPDRNGLPRNGIMWHRTVTPRNRKIMIQKEPDAWNAFLNAVSRLISGISQHAEKACLVIIKDSALRGNGAQGTLPDFVTNRPEEAQDKVAPRRRIEGEAWDGCGGRDEIGGWVAR